MHNLGKRPHPRSRVLARSGAPAALLIALVACTGVGPKKIGDATLPPLAAGSSELPPEAKDAPTVVILPDQVPTIPPAPVVKLAIDRLVSWGMVKAVVDRMEAHGQKAILLVAQREKVRMIELNDELYGPILYVRVEAAGKLCLKHPDAFEKICTQTVARTYIDGAATRELVRKAVLGYERADAVVDIPLSATWGEAVTAVGATRSCCGTRGVHVRLATDDDRAALAASEAVALRKAIADGLIDAADVEGLEGEGVEGEGEGVEGEGVEGEAVGSAAEPVPAQ